MVGPARIWAGTLGEPGRGDEGWELAANGLYREGEHFTALDSSGNATSYPTDAVINAIGRGLPWQWHALPSTSPNYPVTTGGVTDGVNNVSAVLDAWSDAEGVNWFVGPDAIVRSAADPTVPTWHMTPGSGVLAPADDDYASHMVGRYLKSTTSTYETVIAGSTAAADRWGYREQPVDLTKYGPITTARATAIVNAIVAKYGTRPGWATGLEPSANELTTANGVPADLRFVRAGQMVRLHGVTDPTSLTATAYVDVVLGGVRYRAGENRIALTPSGTVATTLADVIAAGGTAPGFKP